MSATTPHIVLVHGGFVDGSGWRAVYDRLTKDGHTVTFVQNPTIRLEGDVATTKQAIERHEGPVVLVGTPTVASSSPKPATPRGRGARVHRRVRTRQGRVGQHPHRRPAARSPRAAHPSARRRVPVPRPRQVRRIVRRQPPPGRGRVHRRLPGPLGARRPQRSGQRAGVAHQAELVPHRHRRPHDPADAQRAMCERIGATTVEVATSHAVYVSQPDAVAALITDAVKAVTSSSR
jgi:hypothetical protein